MHKLVSAFCSTVVLAVSTVTYAQSFAPILRRLTALHLIDHTTGKVLAQWCGFICCRLV